MTLAQLELEAAKLGIHDIHVGKPRVMNKWVCVLQDECGRVIGTSEGEGVEDAVSNALENHRNREAARLTNA